MKSKTQNQLELEMDVDDEGSQHPVKVNTFGIVPNFEMLDEEDKEVRIVTQILGNLIPHRTEERMW